MYLYFCFFNKTEVLKEELYWLFHNKIFWWCCSSQRSWELSYWLF